jgi:tetratricopeptide (TPR) repeat protein
VRSTTKSAFLCLTLAATLVAFGHERADAASRRHVVVEIRTQPGATAFATVTLPNGRPKALAVRQTLSDGARIDVPLRVTVVIASTDAKSTTTLRPDTTFTLLETGAGERSSMTHGSALFAVVPGALSFFAVKYGHAFTASARGTVFSVDTAGRNVTFACNRGTVDVAYAARLQIDAASRPNRATGGRSSGTSAGAAASDRPHVVNAVDVITPDRTASVSFAADAPSYVKTFRTPGEAQALYDAQLIVARQSGDPEHIASALNNRGVLYDDKGDYDRAIEMFNEAIRLNPRDAITFYNRANSYYNKQDYARSIADDDEAIRLDPKFADAYNDRGDSYDNRGNHDRAIVDYDEAIRLSPSDADFYYNRGIAYANKREYDRAIVDYSMALRLDPQMVDAYFNRGLANNSKGNPDGAIADFTDTLRLDPAMADAYHYRGLAYSEKNDLARAIEDYTQSLRLDPSVAAVYDNRALAFSAKDDPNRAIADYDSAVQRAPNQWYPYLIRGLTFLYAGPLGRARADFEKAAAIDPTNAYAALLVEIADRRSHAPSRLPEAAKRLDMKAWPAPIVRLFLGQSSPAATLAAAHDPNVTTQRLQVCLANYYTAEYYVLQGSKDEAARRYALAAHDCPDLLQREPARAGLRSLGAQP